MLLRLAGFAFLLSLATKPRLHVLLVFEFETHGHLKLPSFRLKLLFQEPRGLGSLFPRFPEHPLLRQLLFLFAASSPVHRVRIEIGCGRGQLTTTRVPCLGKGYWVIGLLGCWVYRIRFRGF